MTETARPTAKPKRARAKRTETNGATARGTTPVPTTPLPTLRILETRVLRGYDAAPTILDVARELKPALVAVATHGRTGLGRVALGSVATAVLRRSEYPVLVTRSRPLVGDAE